MDYIATTPYDHVSHAILCAQSALGNSKHNVLSVLIYKETTSITPVHVSVALMDIIMRNNKRSAPSAIHYAPLAFHSPISAALLAQGCMG